MPYHIRSTRCTVQNKKGFFCDSLSAEDVPFPICASHAKELYYHVRDAMGAFRNDKVFALWHHFVEKPQWEKEQEKEKQRRTVQRDSLVYYLQVGQHVKIGYTTNLKQRLASYPPNKRLLATELAASQGLEGKRLLQFRPFLAMANEWFDPAPELIAHINELRERAGAEPIRKFI